MRGCRRSWGGAGAPQPLPRDHPQHRAGGRVARGAEWRGLPGSYSEARARAALPSGEILQVMNTFMSRTGLIQPAAAGHRPGPLGPEGARDVEAGPGPRKGRARGGPGAGGGGPGAGEGWPGVGGARVGLSRGVGGCGGVGTACSGGDSVCLRAV